MKVLFIGGTGNISTASSRLAIDKGWDVYLLTRGKSLHIPKGAHILKADINDIGKVKALLNDYYFQNKIQFFLFFLMFYILYIQIFLIEKGLPFDNPLSLV